MLGRVVGSTDEQLGRPRPLDLAVSLDVVGRKHSALRMEVTHAATVETARNQPVSAPLQGCQRVSCWRRVCNHHPVYLVVSGATVPGTAQLRLSAVRSEQVRTLVTRLVVAAPHTVRTDQLADALWVDQLPPTWSTAIRGVVGKARRWLADEGLSGAIERRAGGYALALPAPWITDLEAGRRAALRAETAAAERDHELAAQLADEAAAWCDGELLDGVEGDWLDAIRWERRQQLTASLALVSSERSLLGDSSRAISAARRLVALEPFGEAGHRILITVLVRAGDRGAAAQVYHGLVRVLRNDLGVEPSLETEALRTLFDSDAAATAQDRSARSTVFLGREAELLTLRDAYADAARGSAQVVVISGAAGIGKSSLVAALTSSVIADGALVLTGGCSRTPAIPYEPLVEALERNLRSLDAGERVDVLRDAQPALAWAIPSISALIDTEAPSGDSSHDRHRLFDALAAHIGGLIDSSTVVLVIDDLHWARQPTLLALRHVIERNAERPLLVVLTQRRPGDNGTTAGLLADIGRQVPVVEVPLVGLHRQAIEEIVFTYDITDDGTHRAGPVGPGQVDRLLDRTGGNPFFIHELLRAAAAGIPMSEVPRRVLDVTALYLEVAGADATNLVRCLAVLDDSIGLSVLRDVTGLDSARFARALDAATATGMIVESSDRRRVGFAHGLARDAVMAHAPTGALLTLHERAALVLERLRSAGMNVSAAELARQFSGAAPLGHAERAMALSIEAARVECSAGAPEDAITRLQRALDLDVTPAIRAAALCELGHSRSRVMSCGSAPLREGDPQHRQETATGGSVRRGGGVGPDRVRRALGEHRARRTERPPNQSARGVVRHRDRAVAVATTSGTRPRGSHDQCRIR